VKAPQDPSIGPGAVKKYGVHKKKHQLAPQNALRNARRS